MLFGNIFHPISLRHTSLTNKIYAHLISMAASKSNQTVIHIYIFFFVWKSIFYGRLSSSIDTENIYYHFLLLFCSLNWIQHLLLFFLFFSPFVTLRLSSYIGIFKIYRCADISTLVMTNLCIRKMLFHFINWRM